MTTTKSNLKNKCACFMFMSGLTIFLVSDRFHIGRAMKRQRRNALAGRLHGEQMSAAE
ncbi:hypothetical protein AWB81_05076 [Caballeronia arationis]|uniref:hypothetical protein n=1 Tax=Caballeronia arationis TaxID=1777142 RepID=UPI00074CDC76|nr:hypothetical protein [Caballeronia arationis]SAK93111.1 hypothetical protein AWB81_05076 [Caballeronia arationis]